MATALNVDEDGNCIIHLLVLQGTVKKLVTAVYQLRDACHLDAQNKLGQSSLHVAVATKRYDCVQLLLLWGANPSCQDSCGRTPLHIACELCDLFMIRILTQDVQKHRSSLPNKPRYDVPHYGNEHIGLFNYNGESCLHIAAKRLHLDAINYLARVCGLSENICERKNGRTILHTAVADAMAAVTVTSRRRSTPVDTIQQHAREDRHLDFLRGLLASDLNINRNATTYDGYQAQDFVHLQPKIADILRKKH